MVDEKAFKAAFAEWVKCDGMDRDCQLAHAIEAYEAARTVPEQTRAWAQDDLDAATDSVWDELNDRGVLSGKASKQAVRIALRALAPVAPPEQATAAVAPGDLDEKAMQAALGAVADFHGDDDIRIARAISAYLQATAAVAPGELTREELDAAIWVLPERLHSVLSDYLRNVLLKSLNAQVSRRPGVTTREAALRQEVERLKGMVNANADELLRERDRLSDVTVYRDQLKRELEESEQSYRDTNNAHVMTLHKLDAATAELAALKARHEALVSKIEAREKQFRSCNQEGEYLHAAECLKYDLMELTALKQTEQPSNPAPAAPQVHEGPLALLSRRVDAVSLLLRELVPAFWTLEHLEAERPDMLAAFKALEQKP